MPGADTLEIDDLLDTTRYPLARPGSADWQRIVSHARDGLHLRGCCVLPGFLTAASIEQLRTESAELAPSAHYDVETVNAYNIALDASLEADHPGRIRMQRRNAFVPRDLIPTNAIIYQLYTHSLIQRFVADCFELPQVHELADPLAGLVLNVVLPGDSHPWHFDSNEFTVTMLTQGPESGGVFEYCPDIRSTRRENFDDVRAILSGDSTHLIRRLTLRPGDLQLFRGRYALHRVSPVGGATARHSAILAYTERAGVIGTPERTRQLFGRVLPEHLAAEGVAVRTDQLLD